MKVRKGLFLLVACALSACSEEVDDPEQGAGAIRALPGAPEGYIDYMVFLADGAFNPLNPETPAPSADWFYKEIMAYSDQQMEERRQEAVEHYRSRFGADVEDPANQGRLALQPFAIDPRTDYRAITVANRDVSSDGWPVRDGGWLLIVTDPDGFVLGEDFAGQRAGIGPAAAFGDYYILTDADPIHIPYQAEKPWTIAPDGEVAFSCDLRSATLGPGRARGLQRLGPGPEGDLQLQIRNVVTFP